MSKKAPTATYQIWIAGDYDDAVRAVKEWCDNRGDCYAVSRVDYVYSGGSESGVCVTRINYARFPESQNDLLRRVDEMAKHLSERLFQKSYSIETPSETIYETRGGLWNG